MPGINYEDCLDLGSEPRDSESVCTFAVEPTSSTPALRARANSKTRTPRESTSGSTRTSTA
jgi:ribulose-bisphosphate carboxylase large chain